MRTYTIRCLIKNNVISVDKVDKKEITLEIVPLDIVKMENGNKYVGVMWKGGKQLFPLALTDGHRHTLKIKVTESTPIVILSSNRVKLTLTSAQQNINLSATNSAWDSVTKISLEDL